VRAKRPTLTLVRHGETEGQSSIRYHGRTDVPLSDLGRMQMHAVRAALLELGSPQLQWVFTSPLVRATEGARLIAGELAQLCVLEDFVEVHFGLFEGLTAEEIRERYPEHYAQWNTERLAPGYAYPDGESRRAFAERVIGGVRKMLSLWRPESHLASTALLVAHRGVIRTAVQHLTGNQPSVELGSIQVIELDGGWRATMLDHIGHLKGV
jgi:broad specificity phosphatase PhoE